MYDLKLSPRPVNPRLLDAELRGALGNAIAGVSTGRMGIAVHFYAAPTLEQMAQARHVVGMHDETALDPRAAQQAADRADYDAVLASLTDGWKDATNSVRIEALRQGVVLCLRMLRK